MFGNSLLFVLFTKQSLRDIWLLRYFYLVNNMKKIKKELKIGIFLKIPKTFVLVSQQPIISYAPICIQNGQEDILYHLI